MHEAIDVPSEVLTARELNNMKKDRLKTSQGGDIAENFPIQGTLTDISGHGKPKG